MTETWEIGNIDNSPLGQATPAAVSATVLKASTDPTDEHGVGDRGYNDGRYALTNYGIEWDEDADTYVRTGLLAGVACGSSPGNSLLNIQAAMRKCLLQDDGIVEYYLDPTDGTKKVGGAAADITSGDDGQVMVQIPAFYVPYAYAGTTHAWGLSQVPREGYSLHPAFVKNDEFVPYRYIGAYEGSMYDASIAGMVAPADIVTGYTIEAGDKLCSLSGQYPKVNETRAEFRAMAAQRGTGWRQMDYDLMSAIQLLYLTEYADFNSQSMISNGRTMFSGGNWIAANQGNGGYIGECGYSNSLGNASGGHSRASALNIAAINTDHADYKDFMSFRGIENFFGGTWTFIDGINIGGASSPADDYKIHVCNNDTQFLDDTWIDYTEIEGILPAASGGYPGTLLQQPRGFIPASGSGGSSITKTTDALWTAAGWRVVTVGGSASNAEYAGAFCVIAADAASYASVSMSGRLAY